MKYLKEGSDYRCKLCEYDEFELSFVDDGSSLVYVCQDCGALFVELSLLEEAKVP